jgi:hypothetical protein
LIQYVSSCEYFARNRRSSKLFGVPAIALPVSRCTPPAFDAAVTLAGRTGVGKSSPATALLRGGRSFVANDVLAVELIDSSRPQMQRNAEQNTEKSGAVSMRQNRRRSPDRTV